VSRRNGIVRSRHWLYWGLDHGFGMRIPHPIQRAIVTVWNHVSCSLMGHDTLTQDDQAGAVSCVSCLRAVRDPGSGVLRLWDMDW
jgi:hypothetical protein